MSNDALDNVDEVWAADVLESACTYCAADGLLLHGHSYHEIFAFCARATGKNVLPVVATTFVRNEVSVATKSSGDTRFCVKGLIREQARKRRVKLLSPLLFSATAIHHLPIKSTRETAWTEKAEQKYPRVQGR